MDTDGSLVVSGLHCVCETPSYLCGSSFFWFSLACTAVLVTYLGSQSLFSNLCMNGVGIAKRLSSGLRFPLVLL